MRCITDTAWRCIIDMVRHIKRMSNSVLTQFDVCVNHEFRQCRSHIVTHVEAPFMLRQTGLRQDVGTVVGKFASREVSSVYRLFGQDSVLISSVDDRRRYFQAPKYSPESESFKIALGE